MKKLRSAAIIGAGLSGLAAGVVLARQGLEVKIFEASHKPGGSCTTSEQDGYIFSDGALWLVGLGLLENAFQRMGLDHAELLPLKRIAASTTTRLPDGEVVQIADSLKYELDMLVNTGAVAANRSELERLLKKWTPVFDPFLNDLMLRPYSGLRFIGKTWRHLPKLNSNVAAEMKRMFSDAAMQAAISGMLLYTGLPPEEMPASQLLGLIFLFNEGYFLPEGGIGRLQEVLVKAFENLGGQVYLNSRARKIVVQDGRVRGLELEEGGLVESDVVLSSLSGMSTCLQLMDPADVPPKLLARAKAAPLSANTFFNVQLGLANNINSGNHLNFVLPMMEDQYKFIHPPEEDSGMIFYAVPTVTAPELAPENGSVIEVFMPASQELPLDAWDQDRKERMGEIAIRILSRYHDMDIAVKRLRSPKDYQAELNLYKSKIYGLTPAILPGDYFPHKTALPGLYLSGQTTFPGYGTTPSMLSGILAAEQILRN